jgi:hypothetical protein
MTFSFFASTFAYVAKSRVSKLGVPLLVLGLATSAMAQNNTASVNIQPSFGGGSGPFTQTQTINGPASAAGSATGGGGASGNASIQMSYGVMRMSGSALFSLNAIARGITTDTITITAPGVANGTVGTLTYSLRVGGTLNATSGSSQASWSIQTNVGAPAFDISRTGRFRAPGMVPTGPGGDPFGVYSATITFTYGFAMPLYLQMDGSAQAANSSSSSGQANFGGPLTLDWLGLSNLTANGSPVTTFTVTSQSGTNWAGDLTPQQCDSIDFNGDGSLFDPTDIDAFLSVFSEGPCIPAGATCNDIDFNNDGSLFDPCDIDSFLLVFSEGPCTLCGV